jgi:glyoxylase-like metal-dependent hydrolase (beta-lactamase superfamily II)
MGTKLTIGSVDILAISDLAPPPRAKLAAVWPDVSADAWVPFRSRFPGVFGDEGTWHNHVGCFLVRASGRLLLVDTGIGLERGGALLDQLSVDGIAPAEIDTVFMTHLHIDHVGWNLTADDAPTFPRARYVMHRAEWEAQPQHAARALSLGQPPYLDASVTPLAALGVLDFLDGEHALTPEVVAVPTPGHSPGHMSVVIASGDEQAIILGDVLLHPAQVTEPDWVSRMDMDGDGARAMRRQVLDRVEAERITMAAGHVRGSGFGWIVRLDGLRYWQGVETRQPDESR